MPLLVTGSTGRVGRALLAVWGDSGGPGMPVLRHGRLPGQFIDIAWNIGHDPAPDLPRGLIILHLTGRIRGTAAELAENRLASEAVCRAALRAGARHVFLMSTAAVYRPAPGLIAEDALPEPQGDYGAAKLRAERAAEAVLPSGLTILRLANVAGADALLGGNPPGREVTLDPIPGQPGGPERSYIGPRALAAVLAQLIRRAVGGQPMPRLVNLAQPPAVAMADLLAARGQPWHFGPPRTGAIPRLALATDRLAALVPLPALTPASLIADLDSLRGWP